MAKETIYYQEDDFLVTNTRCVIGTEVIVMRAVTSVEGVRIRPDVTGPAALVIFGAILFMVLFGADEKLWSAVGVIMFLAGIWLAVFKKRPYAVEIRTMSGEIIRYRSDDRDDITKIIAALNEAITDQGEDADDPDSEDGQDDADGEGAVEGQEDPGEQKN